MQTAEAGPAGAPLESGVSHLVSTPVISSKPDLSAVRALLVSARLPDEDLTDDHLEHFFHAPGATRPLGIVGVELLGDVALLRSLVVRDESRRSGLGSALARRAEEYARSKGVRTLYLLTTTAQDFFAARGYRACQRDAAPDAIRSAREFAAICPASAVFMAKQLHDT
jgi:amino-acid N-acetyltransferase